MSTNARPESPTLPAEETPSYLARGGVRAWLGSLDHKRIALLYLATIAATLVLGTGYAAVLGLERARGGALPADDGLYRRALAAHGLVMVFLVVVPAIPAVLGNFALPLMLGAKNLAFPRLARAGLHLHWLGAALVLGGALAAGPRAGWTFTEAYDPAMTDGGVVVAMLGALSVALAGLCHGIDAIVTIHKLRARGLSFARLPVFAWSEYAASLVAVVAPAPLLGLVALTAAERYLHVGLLDASLGGDPLVFQRLFWMYAQPVLVAAVLSAIGVAGELVAAHARRRPFGRGVVAVLFLALALVSFAQWGVHLVGSGQRGVAALSSLFGLVAAVVVLALLANLVTTLRGGSVALDAPMLFALGTIANLTIWVATSIALGRLDLAAWLRGTSFEVAHQHFGLAGGALTAFLGGLVHWWPKATGRVVDARTTRLGAIGVFLGGNLAFFAQLGAGLAGHAKARADLAGPLSTLAAVGAAGVLLAIASVLLTLGALLASLKWGRAAGADPWGAEGLEWRTSSPPPVDNFAARPAVAA